jgi:hypothetical protein
MKSYRKAAIGFSIGVVGMAACLVLAAIDHALIAYGPKIRETLLWLADPRTAIGMAFGMVDMAGIALCVASEIGDKQ